MLIEQSTIEREFAPLKEISDNYPKYVVTMDKTWSNTEDGIQHMNMIDFLMMEEF